MGAGSPPGEKSSQQTAQDAAPTQENPPQNENQTAPVLGAIASYQGRTVESIDFPDIPKSEWPRLQARSEEHTSELQSSQYLVCRLLLEKKKNKLTNNLH